MVIRKKFGYIDKNRMSVLLYGIMLETIGTCEMEGLVWKINLN